LSDLNKKNPFKVPEDYFYFFGKRIMNKIKTNSFQDGFITPPNYFDTVENEILNKAIKPKNVFISLKYLYRYSAIALILSIFIYFENNETPELDIGEYLIDEYLMENSTYEIVNQFNLNNFSSDLIINSVNSISIDDMYLIKINDEYTSNIILYENE
jgi:hypothetical protein